MTSVNETYLIGCASGLGGADINSGKGPLVVQQSSFLTDLIKNDTPIHWNTMLTAPSSSEKLEDTLKHLYEKLAAKVSSLLIQNKKISVVGGDHSCAIGTWSGVYDALHTEGEIGLLWIDAHMDSHVPETSPSGRIHGMPLACLLGYGMQSFTHILNDVPKIKPENLCLIGTRSFEHGEAELLRRLKVRIYMMEEVRQRGFKTVLREALAIVNKNTIGYGVSLDLDSIDPKEAPGVDVPEPNGIHVKDLADGLHEIASDPRMILTEIVEFDPERDIDRITEKLFVSILEIIANTHAK